MDQSYVATRIISPVAVMSIMAAKAIIKWSLCCKHNSKSRSRRDYSLTLQSRNEADLFVKKKISISFALLSPILNFLCSLKNTRKPRNVNTIAIFVTIARKCVNVTACCDVIVDVQPYNFYKIISHIDTSYTFIKHKILLQ